MLENKKTRMERENDLTPALFIRLNKLKAQSAALEAAAEEVEEMYEVQLKAAKVAQQQTEGHLAAAEARAQAAEKEVARLQKAMEDQRQQHSGCVKRD